MFENVIPGVKLYQFVVVVVGVLEFKEIVNAKFPDVSNPYMKSPITGT
jgi:hypothetical protein